MHGFINESWRLWGPPLQPMLVQRFCNICAYLTYMFHPINMHQHMHHSWNNKLHQHKFCQYCCRRWTFLLKLVGTIFNCGVWCGVVWCGALWCGVERCGIVCCLVLWYSTPQHSTPHTTQHNTTPHHTTPHHTTPLVSMTTPNYTTPKHTTPHHTTTPPP